MLVDVLLEFSREPVFPQFAVAQRAEARFRKDQHPGLRRDCRVGQVQKALELPVVGHIELFVMGFEIGLYHDDLGRSCRGMRLEGVVPHQRAAQRRQQAGGKRQPSDGRYALTRLPVPLPDLKDQQVRQQDPQGSAEYAGVFIPLYPGGVLGEGVAQGQPGPGEIPAQVNVFERDPESDQGQAGQPGYVPLAAPVQEPGHGHESGIDGHRQQPGHQGGIGDPEGRQNIPQHKAVVRQGEPFAFAGAGVLVEFGAGH